MKKQNKLSMLSTLSPVSPMRLTGIQADSNLSFKTTHHDCTKGFCIKHRKPRKCGCTITHTAN